MTTPERAMSAYTNLLMYDQLGPEEPVDLEGSNPCFYKMFRAWFYIPQLVIGMGLTPWVFWLLHIYSFTGPTIAIGLLLLERFVTVPTYVVWGLLIAHGVFLLALSLRAASAILLTYWMGWTLVGILGRVAIGVRSHFLCAAVATFMDLLHAYLASAEQDTNEVYYARNFRKSADLPGLETYSVDVEWSSKLFGLKQDLTMGVFVAVGRDGVEEVWFFNPIPAPLEVVQSYVKAGRRYFVVLPMMFHHVYLDNVLAGLPVGDMTKVVGSEMAAIRHPCPITKDFEHSNDVRLVMMMPSRDEYAVIYKHRATGTKYIFFCHVMTCGPSYAWSVEVESDYLVWRPKIYDLLGKVQEWLTGHSREGCLPYTEKTQLAEVLDSPAVLEMLLGTDFDKVVVSHGGVCSGDSKKIIERTFGWIPRLSRKCCQ